MTVGPANADLTTQQVANLLNVTRAYIVGLLESGELPFHLSGTHQLIRSEDLENYRRCTAAHTRAAADEPHAY